MEVTEIKLSEITTNKVQPRKEFNEDSIQELAESIRKEGFMSPITVREKVLHNTKATYEIVQGERRYKAAEIAGLTEVDAIVRKDLTDGDAFHLAAIEREQIRAIEEAGTFQRYVELGHIHDQKAGKISKGRSYVSRRLRLPKLLPGIQDWIASGKLSGDHAIELLAANSEVCRIMEVCRFIHGTRDPFVYFQRLFMSAYRDSKRIKVNDIKDFRNRFKYLLVSNGLISLIFLAYPSYIGDDARVIRFASKCQTDYIELGGESSKFTVDDMKDMFDYAIKYKNSDTRLWETYKAMEEWEEFMTENDFSLLDKDELVEQLKKHDLVNELNIY